eukprot:SAG11_NODE_23092_length_395_cov_0.861486_2_plen_38_part_01
MQLRQESRTTREQQQQQAARTAGGVQRVGARVAGLDSV